MNRILFGFIAIGLLTFVGCSTSKRNISATIAVEASTWKTVKIGDQEWTTENLNLGHFQNGDIIQEAKTKEEWEKVGKNKEPAWCYYDNNSSNDKKYGKLYNFYAVIDPRGLAPNGWHVPTDAEWTVLTDYLTANGHNGTEGSALKATSGWDYDVDGQSGNGTDDYGFLGLPGGYRGYSGNFSAIGGTGVWWSSSQSSTDDAWYRYLDDFYDYVYRSNSTKDYGFSVRCLRD